ncbi:hypothetical protein M0R04_09910, partial [Candidatus Dojkabacteria bacterium]|nr:hypothetical protein [Candidatus Dojkabacteria bacterium]
VRFEMYYLVRAIRILLEVIGEKKVKRLWEKEGYNWEKTEKLLKRADRLAIEVKAYYDDIEQKRAGKSTKETNPRKYFLKTASKIPAINEELYRLFVFLSMHCSIHRMSIPSEAFKILEHKDRKPLDLSRKPIMPNTQEISQTSD